MGNHTPGPWHVFNDEFPRVGPSHNCTIAGVFAVPAGIEHQRPNAILIAAAPEMLEALEATIEYLGLSATSEANELWGKVGSAIAKATGVSR